MELLINNRTILGKKLGPVRGQGLIPGVVYGKNLKDSKSIQFGKNEFIKILKSNGKTIPLTLKGDGNDLFVLIHDYQTSFVTDELIHVDFLAVSKDEKVVAPVKIVLVGISPAEKNSLGRIQLLKDEVEVEAFPQDLPREIQVDISVIKELGDVIFIKDLVVSDKVSIQEEDDQPVVTLVEFDTEKEEAVAEVAATPTPAATPKA